MNQVLSVLYVVQQRRQPRTTFSLMEACSEEVNQDLMTFVSSNTVSGSGLVLSRPQLDLVPFSVFTLLPFFY